MGLKLVWHFQNMITNNGEEEGDTGYSRWVVTVMGEHSNCSLRMVATRDDPESAGNLLDSN